MNNTTHKQPLLFTLMLSVCIIVPFCNDIFAPALPTMAHYFDSTHIALVMSLFLLGSAIAQPLYGPLSDRFGRRPVLLTGLWLYVAASALVLFSTSLEMLLIARIIQAFGACSTVISALAIARDTYNKDQLIRATSLIMAMIGICPAIAPVLGSFFTATWGWHANFIYLFVLGVVYATLIQCFFKETLIKRNETALHFKTMLANYGSLIKNFSYFRFSLISGCSYGVLFCYFALSPMFILLQFHQSFLVYALAVGINAIAILAGSLLAPKLSKRYSLSKITTTGSILICLGGLAMFGYNECVTASLFSLMIPMFITTLGISLIRPTASAASMQNTSHKIAGSASALFNFVSFIGGAITTAIAPSFVHTPGEFGIFIAALGAIACSFGIIHKRVSVSKVNILNAKQNLT